MCIIVSLCGCSQQTDVTSSTAPVELSSSDTTVRDDSKTITTEYDNELVIQIIENKDVGEEFIDVDMKFFEFTLPNQDKPCAIIGANIKTKKLCIKRFDSTEFKKIVWITGDGGTTYNESNYLMF